MRSAQRTEEEWGNQAEPDDDAVRAADRGGMGQSGRARRRCGPRSGPRRSGAIRPSPTTMRSAQRTEEEWGNQAEPDDDAGSCATTATRAGRLSPAPAPQRYAPG